MKVYAIINGGLDNNGYMMLNKAGVKGKNYIYPFSRVGELMEIVELGDKVIVLSIGVFENCSNLYRVLDLLMKNQTSFESLQEKIKFSNRQPLKESHKDFISKVTQYEQLAVNNCDKAYKNFNRSEMIRTIRVLSLSVVIEVFNHNGLLRR